MISQTQIRKKICICGHARHGKDTVAEILKNQLGFTFQSSSMGALELFLFNDLAPIYNYASPEEAFEDRINKRSEWYNRICAFNLSNPLELSSYMMSKSDIYVGMRSLWELQACRAAGLFDLVIGVYDYRKPNEGHESNDINPFVHTDIVINNSGSLEDLEQKIKSMKGLFLK